LATPTLQKVLPEPVRTIVGDLSDKETVLLALGLTPQEDEDKVSKRILIIDDDEAIRKSFILAFEDIGFKVDTAESGEKGLQMKKDSEYDLIFLDLNMPGMNGVETLRQIRKNDKKVPIYIFTAFHKEFMDQLKVAAGEGYDFEIMQKPMSLDIVSITKHILEKSGVC
jgi:CheY-like chemotaxis protein